MKAKIFKLDPEDGPRFQGVNRKLASYVHYRVTVILLQPHLDFHVDFERITKTTHKLSNNPEGLIEKQFQITELNKTQSSQFPALSTCTPDK